MEVGGSPGALPLPGALPPRAVRAFGDLAADLLLRRPTCGPVRLVAVDGPGGAGKSTFADRLAAALHGAPVVHTDDFAGWDNEFDWYPRLLSQVIKRLSLGEPGHYQRYDWVRRELAEWHDVAVSPVVILEGVGAARREFAPFLSFAAWIQTPAPLRLARGLQRDGADMLGFWHQWIAGENEHFAADDTASRIDLVVDGNPLLPHDPDLEFVRLND
jgi:uridine kinase